MLHADSDYPRSQDGNAQSATIVTIFEDLQCSDCANFRKILDTKLLPKYAKNVLFVHFDFPLPKHDWARKAAEAARFFGSVRPELGTSFRKQLFLQQAKITAKSLPAVISAFAAKNKIAPTTLQAALANPALAAAVEEDFQYGVARGIGKTPTVLLDGQLFIENFPLQDLEKALDQALLPRP